MNTAENDHPPARLPRETTILFGHAEAERELLDSYKTGRTAHAWLIGGPRGVGKATLAYRFARFIFAHPDSASPQVRNASSLLVDAEHPVARRMAAQTQGDLLVLERTINEQTGKLYTVIRVEDVRRTIEHIKHKLPSAFVIAGNVGTPEGVIDLENWGADATKVGIGPGKVCITRLKTGFGTGGWQLSALKWCARVATKPIVADGGIRHHGDIAKSVRFGAAMVMIGSLFAGHEESPGQTVEVDGKLYKEYYGSASDFNKGEYKHVEGKRILEPIKGRFADTLREMREDLQSSISYAGGRVLADLRKVNYVILGGENAGEHLFM